MLHNALLHIIDHGSLVYLILLQIRFYDQQDFLPLATPYGSSADAITATMMKTSIHEVPSYASPSYDGNDSTVTDVMTIQVYSPSPFESSNNYVTFSADAVDEIVYDITMQAY